MVSITLRAAGIAFIPVARLYIPLSSYFVAFSFVRWRVVDHFDHRYRGRYHSHSISVVVNLLQFLQRDLAIGVSPCSHKR